MEGEFERGVGMCQDNRGIRFFRVKVMIGWFVFKDTEYGVWGRKACTLSIWQFHAFTRGPRARHMDNLICDCIWL